MKLNCKLAGKHHRGLQISVKHLPGSWLSGPWECGNTPVHTASHRSNTPGRRRKHAYLYKKYLEWSRITSLFIRVSAGSKRQGDNFKPFKWPSTEIYFLAIQVHPHKHNKKLCQMGLPLTVGNTRKLTVIPGQNMASKKMDILYTPALFLVPLISLTCLVSAYGTSCITASMAQ